MFTHLAGITSASNSATKCLRIILFDGGMPRAVAIVSPVKDGSNTTRPPCTPLSANYIKLIGFDKKWNNFKIMVYFSPFRLSANSPKSILWAHLINRWLVQTKGSASTFSHWCRLTAKAYNMNKTIRKL